MKNIWALFFGDFYFILSIFSLVLTNENCNQIFPHYVYRNIHCRWCSQEKLVCESPMLAIILSVISNSVAFCTCQSQLNEALHIEDAFGYCPSAFMQLDCTELHSNDLQTPKIFNSPNPPKYLKQKKKNHQPNNQPNKNNNKKSLSGICNWGTE